MTRAITRRGFIQSSVAAATAAHGLHRAPAARAAVPDGPPLKAGLIGCGGRGSGAAADFLSGSKDVKIVALADVFSDRLERTRDSLQKRNGQEIPADRCYVGFDAYRKLIASDVDVVLLATPPHFRAAHFAAAVEARKHVFMEKPVAVDPAGVRSVIATGEKAKERGLCVVAGTQRRHQSNYVEVYKRVADGAIGEIVAARAYWNQGQLWFRERDPKWSDMEWMIRDWVNWTWLSGDHIVEQHVHNLDVINWFTGSHPVKAVGMGGRMRRVTGDQYDFFSVDFTFPSGMHELSQCRQINGCANSVSEYIVGTKGSTNCADRIFDVKGNVVWAYDGPPAKPYVQEHTDLVAAIRSGKPINEARNVAESTLGAIMARISAYTGKETTWDEVLNSDLRLGPTEYALGPVPMGKVPVPGMGEPKATTAG
jgi:myo-inositol 2-dehydrogenase/D-chiro-inositol 1-dehydrogenase